MALAGGQSPVHPGQAARRARSADGRWTGDWAQPPAPVAELGKDRAAVRTEIAWLRLGELESR